MVFKKKLSKAKKVSAKTNAKVKAKAGSVKKKVKSKKFYIFAYDPEVKKRVTYEVKNGVAKSLVSGHKFKYKKGK